MGKNLKQNCNKNQWVFNVKPLELGDKIEVNAIQRHPLLLDKMHLENVNQEKQTKN